jgi:hypothetical protein
MGDDLMEVHVSTIGIPMTFRRLCRYVLWIQPWISPTESYGCEEADMWELSSS